MFRGLRMIALAAILAVAFAGMQGCNTFRGAGTDIRRGGEAIENSANEVEFHAIEAGEILASL